MKRLGLVCLVLLFVLAGCAVGFDPEGRPVVGMGIGETDADAVRRAATGLAGFLPEPWGTVAVTGISAVFGAIGIGSARSASRNRRKAEAKQSEADAAYDEATAAKVRAAESEGRHTGFDEGSARTAPVTVVPGPIVSRVVGSVPA